jgi:hypothetical protein
MIRHLLPSGGWRFAHKVEQEGEALSFVIWLCHGEMGADRRAGRSVGCIGNIFDVEDGLIN